MTKRRKKSSKNDEKIKLRQVWLPYVENGKNCPKCNSAEVVNDGGAFGMGINFNTFMCLNCWYRWIEDEK